MRTLRQLRNFWILWVATIVLPCFSDAVAQASYKVTDLGTQGNDNLGCAMSVNNQGRTEIMAGNVEPAQQDSLFGKLRRTRGNRITWERYKQLLRRYSLLSPQIRHPWAYSESLA